jgi:curved DNA-binding protein CbpA
MQDHYETLQVHPKADHETIQAAYERLRERHDPEKLEGAADELIELARSKRNEIERAYAVLGDKRRRARYDEELHQQQIQEQAAQHDDNLDDDDMLDYRPLPPARGQERPRTFNPQPSLTPRQAAQRGGRRATKALPPWGAPALVVAGLTFAIVLSSLLLTEGGQLRYANDTSAMQQNAAGEVDGQQNAQDTQDHPDVNMEQLFREYDGQVFEARRVVQELPENPNAWINLGNALYDSAQVVRELRPESELYAEVLPRWLEASEAYETALDLGVDEPVVRSDMGVSLCYYGTDTGEIAYVEDGLVYTQQAIAQEDQNGRVLLNHGICLANTQPPQIEEALALWREVQSLPAAEVGVTQQAQQLVEVYGQ